MQAALDLFPSGREQKTSLRAWSRLTAHYQVVPSIISGETNTFILTSFVQPIPPMERQTKEFYLQFENTTVKREERRGEEIVF